MDGDNGEKTIVYNTKRDSKKGEGKKKKKKSERLKKDNSKKREFHIIDHTIRAYPKIRFVFVHEEFFPFNTINQYLFPIFRLAFSPTLYKFIVWAFWT